jgi:hypothetical protein
MKPAGHSRSAHEVSHSAQFECGTPGALHGAAKGDHDMTRRHAIAIALALVPLAGAAHTSALERDEVQAPRAYEYEAPRSDEVQAPRGYEYEAPRSDEIQAPRGERTVEAPER